MDNGQFSSWGADRAARWTLVTKLIHEWFPPISGAEPGVAESDVIDAERRLGIVLPAALREWYLQFGRLPEVWNVQDRLLAPADLQMEEGRLVFARENQNVVVWFIEAGALAIQDPPVMVSDPSDAALHQVAAPSVTEFAVQFLVLNTKFSGRALFSANGQVTDQAIDIIQQHLRKLPFGDLYWPPYPTRLYGDSDIIVEVEALTWIWITARSRQRFDPVRRAVETAGVEWADLRCPE